MEPSETREPTFIKNEALLVKGKPATFVNVKQGDSGTWWVQVQFDNGDYDWFAADDVKRWPEDA